MNSPLFLTLAIVGGGFLLLFVLVLLFAPAFPYRLLERLDIRSPEFERFLSTSTAARVHEGNALEIFPNGDRFYPAMLETIRGAEHSVNLECYIFRRGSTADRFVAALSERARAGVQVRVLLDAIGCFRLVGGQVTALREAGCQVGFYQPIRWHSLSRLNSRTHRELLIVDGRTAVVGGAGVADTWGVDDPKHPRWRDTMARVRGPVVAAVQSAFAENWLEYNGEMLTGDAFWPPLSAVGRVKMLFVKSSNDDRATVSRVLFQSMVECAGESLRICTPYFLPDRILRQALIAAARRGVQITVIVPGPGTDQRWVRLVSRRLFGELLEAGLRIFEYQPAMIHQKMMVIDDEWVVFGTTNIDNRSFEHNDEDDLVINDREVAARFTSLHAADLERCREVTAAEWQQRPIWERMLGAFAWFLERQQ